MKKLIALLFSVLLLTAFCSACQPSGEKPQTDVEQSESDLPSDSASDDTSDSTPSEDGENGWSEWA